MYKYYQRSKEQTQPMLTRWKSLKNQWVEKQGTDSFLPSKRAHLSRDLLVDMKKKTGGKSVAVTNQPPSWNRIKTYARIFLSGNFSEIDLGICIGNLHSNSHKFPDLPYTSLAR